MHGKNLGEGRDLKKGHRCIKGRQCGRAKVDFGYSRREKRGIPAEERQKKKSIAREGNERTMRQTQAKRGTVNRREKPMWKRSRGQEKNIAGGKSNRGEKICRRGPRSSDSGRTRGCAPSLAEPYGKNRRKVKKGGGAGKARNELSGLGPHLEGKRSFENGMVARGRGHHVNKTRSDWFGKGRKNRY